MWFLGSDYVLGGWGLICFGLVLVVGFGLGVYGLWVGLHYASVVFGLVWWGCCFGWVGCWVFGGLGV